jgi:hypothetical protein
MKYPTKKDAVEAIEDHIQTIKSIIEDCELIAEQNDIEFKLDYETLGIEPPERDWTSSSEDC